MSEEVPNDVTRWLEDLADGDRAAWDRILPVMYGELRTIAERCYKNHAKDQTLQPTALVHEAYARLAGREEARWNDRVHFLAVAATAMRGILVDETRKRQAQKRGGDWQRVTLANAPLEPSLERLDVLDLDEALRALTALSERQAKVVELRFFGGLTTEQIARVIGASTTTVENEWRLARAWLTARLRGAR